MSSSHALKNHELGLDYLGRSPEYLAQLEQDEELRIVRAGAIAATTGGREQLTALVDEVLDEPFERPTKLVIEIELGNDAMQSVRDVEHAIERAFDHHANRYGTSRSFTGFELGDDGTLVDANGNTVGRFEVRS